MTNYFVRYSIIIKNLKTIEDNCIISVNETNYLNGHLLYLHIKDKVKEHAKSIYGDMYKCFNTITQINKL